MTNEQERMWKGIVSPKTPSIISTFLSITTTEISLRLTSFGVEYKHGTYRLQKKRKLVTWTLL